MTGTRLLAWVVVLLASSSACVSPDTVLSDQHIFKETVSIDITGDGVPDLIIQPDHPLTTGYGIVQYAKVVPARRTSTCCRMLSRPIEPGYVLRPNSSPLLNDAEPVGYWAWERAGHFFARRYDPHGNWILEIDRLAIAFTVLVGGEERLAWARLRFEEVNEEVLVRVEDKKVAEAPGSNLFVE
jgi:hypothetical protein